MQEFGLQAGDYFEFIYEADQQLLLKTSKKEARSNHNFRQESAEKRAEKLYKRKLARLFLYTEYKELL